MAAWWARCPPPPAPPLHPPACLGCNGVHLLGTLQRRLLVRDGHAEANPVRICKWEQARLFVWAHMEPHPCRGSVHGVQFGRPRLQASTTCALCPEQHMCAGKPQMASPCHCSPVKVARKWAMSSTRSGTYTAFSPSCCSAALWMAGLRLRQRQRWMGQGKLLFSLQARAQHTTAASSNRAAVPAPMALQR